MKIGIIKEGKVPVDHRVPFTPTQLQTIQQNYDVDIVVQKSDIRCFEDEEYSKAGFELVDDVADCDILFGVKEVPIPQLIKDKTYLFFSHTIKAQPYNSELLQTIISKNINLIDYETLKNPSGQRVVAFGRYAGIVGAYNGILTYGKKFGLFDLKPANQCFDMEEMWGQFSKVKLPPIKIVLTGGGRVSQGSMEVLDGIGIQKVSANDFIYQTYEHAVYTQLDSDQYNQLKSGEQEQFDFAHFYANPTEYEGTFLPYTRVADLLIAGAYWDPKAPVLFERADVAKPDFNIKVVADITCDIEGSVPTTLDATTIDNPVYDLDKNTFEVLNPYSGEKNISVMSVDNLPCELPRDASTSFGDQLIKNVLPELLGEDLGMVDKATIAKNGDLNIHYEYLRNYVDNIS